jgi:hypothetical protein
MITVLFVVCGHLSSVRNWIAFGLCHPFREGPFCRKILYGITQARLGGSSLLSPSTPGGVADLACLIELDVGSTAYQEILF